MQKRITSFNNYKISKSEYNKNILFLSDIKITKNNQELYNSIIEKLIFGLKSELIKEELINYVSFEIINEDF